jgi:hypothetical protein
MISTSQLLEKLQESIVAEDIIDYDRIVLDGTPDPNWDHGEIVSLFESELMPICAQNMTCGYKRSIQVKVIGENFEKTTDLFNRVCIIIEKSMGNTFIILKKAFGKAESGTKIENAFVGVKNYTVYTKGE